jgi:hypothetical protein
MSLTFGTIIADRDLQLVGLKSLMLGIFLSILFGFIFGLILGTTEMPWGYNDWPTDEMKGRYGEQSDQLAIERHASTGYSCRLPVDDLSALLLFQRELQVALDGRSLGSSVRHRRRSRPAARQQRTVNWRRYIGLVITASCQLRKHN